MGLDFVSLYEGCRLQTYAPQPILEDESDSEEETGPNGDQINLDFEQDQDKWTPIDLKLPPGWQPSSWDERPVRFIDGKDVGYTIAWIRASGGYPVPIRLSQIGSVAVCLVNGECRREFAMVERVVSMVVDPFPWYEVESFAAALQANGLRLLPAFPPGGQPSYDFELMRKATENRSSDEMGVLEEAAIAQNTNIPTIVDGRLESRRGGFDTKTSPVFGIIKTHYKKYLHNKGMQILYQLEPGQRTPVFSLPSKSLPVLSWYIRLAGGNGATPNWGIVRVEVPLGWFKEQQKDAKFINQLSYTIYVYRCREHSYRRAAVSLHPIVRAEESLNALFSPAGMLTHHFYRLTGL
jgi:hypothetical protein